MLEFDYARNALRYLINEYEIKELYIPYYLCEVIRHSVFAEKCKPIFYHIKDNFMPEKELPENAYILYPNYFGICDKNVEKLANIYPKLIVDNAHAFYAQPSGWASFNSARKFLPTIKKAYLYFSNEKNTNMPDTYRRSKFMQLHEQYKNINSLKIELDNFSIPFCYPYLAGSTSEADELVKSLKANGKIIYRYWEPPPKTYNEYKFYSRLVPIPISVD